MAGRPPSDFRPRPDPRLLRQPLRTETELHGTIERVVYTSEDGTFSVVRFLPRGEETHVTLAGNLIGIAAGEPIHARGSWRLHKQHGATFEVEHYVPVLPSDPEMLKAYLGSGLVKGIGKSRAANIVEHFGKDTMKVLDEAPERLREVKGVGAKHARAIADAWAEHRATHEIMLVLQRYGLSQSLAKRLFRHYGQGAASILKSNPYRVGMEVHGIGFKKADLIARGLGVAGDSPQRLAAALLHLLSEASDRGHTFLPREELIQTAVELTGAEAAKVEEVFESEAAIGRHMHVEQLPDGVSGVFLKSLYLSESGCARLLIRLANASRPLVPPDTVEPRLDQFEARFNFQLAPQQRQAIHAILRGGVSVVTGGPGTGKTTLVRALLHVLKKEGEEKRIALCSPTGRAAQRLSETTRQPAFTIHRLLRYDPHSHQFSHDADAPLEADLIIVDESSMLDIPLAYHLLKAVPASAGLVFVGDVDQLPSVGAGCFLKDIIASGRARVTRLDTIFRQARASMIIVNSHRINAGEMPLTPDPTDSGDVDFYVVKRDDPQGIREALLTLATERIPRKFGFDPLEDVQVLTPMHQGELGTRELNALLQAKLNPSGQCIRAAGQELRVGDKVIQLSNNYELEVFNGDLGRVESVSETSNTLTVRFGRRKVEYRFDETDQLSLAYAVTIHKSQGSEYPVVVVVLHTQHFVMLKRNLIYTGVTRGKKLVILIGSEKAVGIALRNGNEEERRSALRHWLVRPPNAGELFA